MSDSFFAALLGLGGALTLEMLRHFLSLGQKNTQRSLDDATSFRQDLLRRINALEDDCVALAKERDEWQSRYYAERERRAKAEWQIEALGGTASTPSATPSG